MIRLRIHIFTFLVIWLFGQSVLAQSQAFDKLSSSPQITSQFPALGATNVDITTQIALQFDQPIQIGTGNLIIQKKQDQAPVQIIEAQSSQVQTRGKRLIVNLIVPLA